MSATKLSATRVAPDQTRIDLGRAALVWLGCWLLGNIVGSSLVAATGHTESATAPTWVLLMGAACTWVPLVVGVWVLSRRFGTGSLVADYGLRWRTADLVGIPVGVLSQLVLVRLLYWPLQELWPATFGRERVEQSARHLADNATGAWYVVLVAVVVVGAPMVEELVYRGLLQGAAARRFHEAVAVVGVAAWFALVHFRPVEYPGLFLFGLVLGVCALRTRRLGLPIVTHMAFNATGLLLVATSS
jgi:membrane protease YdiL (CAAX protease family)